MKISTNPDYPLRKTNRNRHGRVLRLLLFAFAIFTFPLWGSAQQISVQGQITDESGSPLVNATVVVKGTNQGVTSNTEGRYQIEVPGNGTLVFSSVGFLTREVSINNQTNIDVTLSISATDLEQVIVVGYGTQKRAEITGAISSVSNETLNAVPVTDVSTALQGRVPGLDVVSNGSPGTTPIISIRGISSITYASNPLYVIDGFPTTDLSGIDMRDVESIDVLKDASSAAIYGSRATNGVIMVTTKKGKRDGQLRVNVNSYYGVQKITKRIDLLDPAGFDEYAIAYRGSKVDRRLSPWAETPIYDGASTTYGNNVTDWQDAYFKTGVSTQNQISLEGGNEKSRFYTSMGYYDQTGTSPGVKYQRYNIRLNSEHKISNVFDFGENLTILRGVQHFDNNETGSRSNLLNVIRMMPYMPVYDPTTDGGFRGVNSVLDGGDPTNPVEDALLKNPGTRTNTRLLGTIYANVHFTKWLTFTSTAGIDYRDGLTYLFSPIFDDHGTIAGSSAILATITNNRAVSASRLFTQRLTFDDTFGSHHINAIAVYEFQGAKTTNENAAGNQASNDIRVLNNATNTSVQTLRSDINIVSYLGRINYDFEGKYLFSGALRRDGASYWAEGMKWRTFPSVSAGWRLDQEAFLQNNSTISEMKLRAGYGVTGLNGEVLGATPWLAGVDSKSAFYPFDNDLPSGPASSINGLGNAHLEWETTKQFNVGMNLGFMNNRLTVVAEYYTRKTDNLILSVPLPPSMGFINSSVNTNAGAMRNNGFELQLGYNKFGGDFTWGALANLSTISNKVFSLADGVANIETGDDADFTEGYKVTRTAPGHPVQSFYGYIVEGIFQSDDEVAHAATQTDGTAAGDIRFRDVDGNGVIDGNDRAYLGSFIPDFTYSLNLNGGYKNFNLSLFFQGVQGNKIYNATRTATEGMIRFFNAGTKVLNAWTPSNTNTDVPRAIGSDPNDNARVSTRFLESGSYMRLKNVRLSYSVPGTSLASFFNGAFKGAEIYVAGQNLFTITNYSGFDPEVGNRTPSSSITNGIDYAVYPQPKGFQVGVNLNF